MANRNLHCRPNNCFVYVMNSLSPIRRRIGLRPETAAFDSERDAGRRIIERPLFEGYQKNGSKKRGLYPGDAPTCECLRIMSVGSVCLPPFLLFKAPAEKPVKEIEKKTEKDDHESGKPLLCKFCKHKITHRGAAIDVNGSHKHVFANPGGFVFEIGCFRMAPGCVNHGPPTSEFTWFSGFNWRFSLCSKCHSHLGWHYLSNDAASFFGLIMDNLIEGKE